MTSPLTILYLGELAAHQLRSLGVLWVQDPRLNYVSSATNFATLLLGIEIKT